MADPYWYNTHCLLYAMNLKVAQFWASSTQHSTAQHLVLVELRLEAILPVMAAHGVAVKWDQGSTGRTDSGGARWTNNSGGCKLYCESEG